MVIPGPKTKLVGPSYKRDVAVLQKKGVISYLRQVWLSGESINPDSPTLLSQRRLKMFKLFRKKEKEEVPKDIEGLYLEILKTLKIMKKLNHRQRILFNLLYTELHNLEQQRNKRIPFAYEFGCQKVEK